MSRWSSNFQQSDNEFTTQFNSWHYSIPPFCDYKLGTLLDSAEKMGRVVEGKNMRIIILLLWYFLWNFFNDTLFRWKYGSCYIFFYAHVLCSYFSVAMCEKICCSFMYIFVRNFFKNFLENPDPVVLLSINNFRIICSNYLLWGVPISLIVIL